MTSDDEKNISVSVPMSLIAAAVAVVSGAAAAYMLANRNEEESGPSLPGPRRKSGKSARSYGRRVGLKALIALIENDASRKVVVAALRAMARRA
jgi:hypothetical protein